MSGQQKDETILLNAIGAGDQNAPGRLLELVYDDLRRLPGSLTGSRQNKTTSELWKFYANSMQKTRSPNTTANCLNSWKRLCESTSNDRTR